MKKSKRTISILLSFLMMLSVLGSFPKVALAAEMKLSQNEIQVTKKGKVEIDVDFGKEVKAENLIWTLDNKDVKEWKSFNEKTAKYDLKPWISISGVKVDGTKVHAVLENDLPYGVDTTDHRPYPRWTFETLMGTYPLKVTDKESNISVTAQLKINNYEGFHHYDEIKPHLDKIIESGNKKGDRYFEYQSIGKSSQGRDMHFIIVAKDRAAVDNYLNNTFVAAHTNPQGLIDKINNKTMGNYQVPIFINNVHPDESPGVDAQINFLERLANNDEISFNTTNAGAKKSLKVEDILDNFILLFDITQNPDGKQNNKRENGYNLDLNRDNVYQTQEETKALAKTFAKYDPIAFLDLHGFVKDFLIEPCTPPHEPNFEYDLLMGGIRDPQTKDVKGAPGAIEHARHMGNIAIANTKYESFIIPMFDYGDGWDDGFLGYTGVFALIHGTLGHTVEIPDQNEDGMKAHVHTVIGSIDYILNNKDALYKNQLTVFKRGLENEDNKGVDTWHLDPNGKQIGRPRGNNANFFPDYYILPLDSANQKNDLEVYNMIEYFLRNGVKVYKSTQEVEYKGVKYPAGSIILPLNQVKKSLVNSALFTGTDESAWGAMYAELVLNFPAMRGFDRVEVRQKGLFDGKMSEVTSAIAKPETQLNGLDSEKTLIRNTNNDVTRLVNKMLANNAKVEIVTQKSKTASAGDFVVKTSDLKANVSGLYVKAEALKDEVSTKELTAPKIYITPSGSDYASTTDSTRFVLKDLGFNLVKNAIDANTIVDSSGQVKKEEIDGKNYIAIGGEALAAAKENKLYPISIKMNEDGEGNEGLLKAKYDISSPLTGMYNTDDLSYIASGTVITKANPSAKVFAKVKDSSDFYIQGWWPNHGFVRDQILGFADKYNGTNFVFFAEDVTNKAHTAHLFRQLSNSIYAVNNDTFKEGNGLKSETSGLKDIKGHWAENAINSLVEKGILNGYQDMTFKPDGKITRAEFVKTIVCAFDLKSNEKVTFKDIEKHWAKNYIEVAAALKIVNGYSAEEFGPNKNITREEMSKIIANVLKLSEKTELKFTDNDKISEWAKESVEKVVKAELVKGYPDSSFKPNNNVTRAESATIIERALNK
ncbi:S-layer homology domain-containing protein [Peptoniphilus mikwangii]|uniref:S-layer homology domain-containing protein n=1 Tax=Peptoniphilus mikwangii TaxID=1354300 RepID=UPI0003FB9017|nr:S-layer homology domain-containing protein [Peptoniphilus mikwangii]